MLSNHSLAVMKSTNKKKKTVSCINRETVCIEVDFMQRSCGFRLWTITAELI